MPRSSEISHPLPAGTLAKSDANGNDRERMTLRQGVGGTTGKPSRFPYVIDAAKRP
jgi:hypothetical protein